ncbi:DUF2849 domain containing protein [Sulfitobacter noctilucicola]|uniref:DUF2849 domain-containing protein n=1 Tax=Sulfitobacter noctilucicola TaxID=1342301 RepID=A0A7W6Q5G3_9RHOB|nr:DUF2849 domain-containing protein [Sulfitobacter noctilucicola]KIN66368.1 DUF2849 domain containing protein [Sulfitobacter noctilucicola]MBB4175718.1 hypothetical protein [Sulfitobacter noctilucicola]
MPKPFTPKVVTANALLEGDVIYLSADGWTRDLSQADVLTDEADADLRLIEASAQVDTVVGVYLADVDVQDGVPVPVHFREAFRAKGPSNYIHGKQEAPQQEQL